MGFVSKLKRKFALNICKKNSAFFKVAVKINLFFFHFSERQHMEHWGKEDPNCTYYIIRPRSKDEGLLSTYYYVMGNICWANKNGYLPYVDFETSNCQYHVNYHVYGTKNAWEYYFEQPSAINKLELVNKKNVLMSGWTLLKDRGVPPIVRNLETVQSETLKFASKKYCPIRKEVWERAEKIYEEKFSEKNTLALFLRGTDYIALRPSGHFVQPEIDNVINKINEFLQKYRIDQIFIITEDISIYKQITETYGNMVFTVDGDLANDYFIGNYVSASMNSDPYQRGFNYLIRVILMTKCEYLIAGITNGSLFGLNIKEDEYKDSYWFELGIYD